MKLGAISKTRAALGRPMARWLVETEWVRRRARAARPAEALDQEIAAMLAIDDLSHDSHVWRWTPKKARKIVAEGISIIDDRGAKCVAAEDRMIPGPGGPLLLRIYVPDGILAPSPALFFIHGGGWVTGSVPTHDAFCRRLAASARIRVTSVDYRLAPESPYPAAVDDCLAAFRWVASEAESLGIDPSRIAVGGDSAGGNLSAVIGHRTRGDAHRPSLLVLIYPALDGTCALGSHAALGAGYMLTKETIDWYYGHYLGPDALLRRAADVSPLLAPDLGDMPPALIASAGFDPLCDEARAFAERLDQAGVLVLERRFPSLIHGFVLMGGLSTAARRASFEIVRLTERALYRGAADAFGSG